MKWILATIVLLLVTGSLYADYKWRQWIAARRAERENQNSGNPFRRD
jgi:hypothetical protein